MSDLTKTGKELFFELVNSANSGLSANPLSDSNVTLSAPADDSTTDKNTTVTITAIDEKGYTGSVDVFYDRLDIATLFSDASLTANLDGDDFAHASDLLAPLNTKYGLNLKASDIEEADLSSQEYPGSVTLTIAAGSFAYTGSLAITLNGVQTPLTNVVETTSLDGLTAPDGGIAEV